MKENIIYLKKSLKYFKSSKKLVIIFIFAGFIFSLLSAIFPIVSARLITAMTENTLYQVLLLASVMLIANSITRITSFIVDALYYKITGKVVFEIQQNIAQAILNLETKNFDETSSGVFIKRMDDDPYEITNTFNTIRRAITNTLTNIGVLVLVFFINAYIGLFFVLSLFLIYIIQKHRIVYRNQAWKEYKEINDTNSGIFSEILKGVRDIKVLNLKEPFMDYTMNALKKSYIKSRTLNTKNSFYWGIDFLTRDIICFVFILLGLILIQYENLTASNFIILYMYINQIFVLVNSISELSGDLKDFEIAAKRIFEVTEYSKFTKETYGQKEIGRIEGNIEFQNVTFGYQKEHPILKELNLKINANDTVAIVGRSGEGKTTLFSLLAKLYQPDQGNILIDGIPLNQLKEQSLRKNISMITQNPYIFNMSIKENLRLTKPDATEEEMIEKCKLASLHDYIMSLDKKYDTIIGEGGVNLSGGQKQRLAIARALLKDTEIILFDEATSALDNETQKEIQKSIQNISKDYTILIIAHRLSTIDCCNKIIVINDGKVDGIGTHQELLKTNKIYRELYQGNLE